MNPTNLFIWLASCNASLHKIVYASVSTSWVIHSTNYPILIVPYRPQPPAVPCVCDHCHTLPNGGHTEGHGSETAVAACSCSCHNLQRDIGSHYAVHFHKPGHHLLLQLSSILQPCSGKSNQKKVWWNKEVTALIRALLVLTGGLELMWWRGYNKNNFVSV